MEAENAAAQVLELQEYLAQLERLAREDTSGVIRPQLLEVLRDENGDAHFGIYVDSKVLLDDDCVLGHLVLRYPETMLNLFSKALVAEQERLLRATTEDEGEDAAPNRMRVKKNVHARVNWLPGANRKPNISSIRSVDVKAFIQVSGTVTRTGAVKVLEAERVFECNNDSCSSVVRVFASKHEVGTIVEKPTGPCPSCKKTSSYTEFKERSVCHDFQELKIQEQVQKLGMGSIPRSITVLVLHDLVDKCKAGDDLVITGVPIHRWSPVYVGERCNLDTVIEANTIEVINASSNGVLLTEEVENKLRRFWKKWTVRKWKPVHGRNLIVGSICPQIHGMFTVKLAVALALTGCPPFVDRGGNKVRGEPHLLLVGDPGTGKSQFLRFAAKVSPRSVLTTGTGTTSAGLTCSAVRDGGEFMLEAGALVLADRGVCCIDEFGSIREHDRATIHEAMEQQTLSVAKAGLVCTLQTRTTIIAATNPRGQYDAGEDISTNTAIAAPLLSRFDMVLVLLDKSDQKWDRTVSEFILKAQAGLGNGTRANRSNDDESEEEGEYGDGSGSALGEEEFSKDSCPTVDPSLGMWSVDTWQAYLAYVKSFDPKLTPEAAKILTAYYKNQRHFQLGHAGRATLRLLESLIRVAKAHARLMARKHVVIVDAVEAIHLVQMSMRSPQPQDSLGDLGFPEEPDRDLYESTMRMLDSLQLEDLRPIAKNQFATNFVLDLNYGFTRGADDDESEDSDDSFSNEKKERKDRLPTTAPSNVTTLSPIEDEAEADCETGAWNTNPFDLPTQVGTSKRKRKSKQLAIATSCPKRQRKKSRKRKKRGKKNLLQMKMNFNSSQGSSGDQGKFSSTESSSSSSSEEEAEGIEQQQGGRVPAVELNDKDDDEFDSF